MSFTDPRFPDRPQHPDFRRLSSVLIQLDARAQEMSLPETVEGLVDLTSLEYAAEQRAGMAAAQLGLPPRMGAVLQAMFMNAFVVGLRFEQEGGHRDGGGAAATG